MSDEAEKIIFPESPESARKETVEVWVSRNGRVSTFAPYCGSEKDESAVEQAMRFFGATHVHCEAEGCQGAAKRPYNLCDDCRAKNAAEAHAKRQRQEWDFDGPIYSEAYERFFQDEDEIMDYLRNDSPEPIGEDEDDLTDELFERMEPVICEQRPIRQLENDDFQDEQDEDGEVPDVLDKAIEAFNKAIEGKDNGLWYPTDIVATLPKKEGE